MLTVRAPKGPNAQDEAGRPVAAVGHYNEDMMGACRPPGIAGEVSHILRHTVGVPTASEETHFVVLPDNSEDETMHRETLEKFGRSPATGNKRTVLTMEGLEGPSTQDKAERFMTATGHHPEDVVATCHPPGIAGEVAGKIVQHPVGLPTTLEDVW